MSLLFPIDKTTLHYVLWENQEYFLGNFELRELNHIHKEIMAQLEDGLI